MNTKEANEYLNDLSTKDEVEDVGWLWSVAEHFRDKYESLKKASLEVLNEFEHDPKTVKQSDAFDALEKEWAEP